MPNAKKVGSADTVVLDLGGRRSLIDASAANLPRG